jgi:hypothetical protein
MASMDKYVELIKMLEKIFGKGAVSRTIGTRTNVVRFPKGQIVDDLDTTKSEYNIEKAAEKKSMAYEVVKKDIEDRMGDITKMNDSDLLNYTANVRRMMNVEFPPPLPEADIVKFGSGQEIKGKGLEELIEKQGIKNPPTTAAGQLETTGKRLEQLGKDFAKEFDAETIAKQEADRQAMIARQYEGKGYAGGVFGPSGMYRAVARDFLLDQHAKGKIKLDADTLKNLEERNYISGGQPLMYADPIRVMRYHYGDDVFEKIPLDKIPTGARSEIIDVMSKVEAPPIKTEAPKTPGGYLTPGEYRANIEELQGIENAIKRRESRFADMTEEEIQNELAQYGGKRSSFEMGLEYDYPEEYAKYKGPKKPEPEEKADGGRIGYAKGKRVKSSIDKLLENLNKKTQGKKSMESVNPKTGEVTIPKKPIKRAEEPTGVTVMDAEPEIVDERSIPKKAGEGRFTKQQVLEKIIQKTIETNPTDEYVQTTFPNFIKELRANPELANNENVWNTFTQDFPKNKKLVVYGDDTVDFFTKGENLPEGMKQTIDLVDTYGISMKEARRIKQLEPEDQVMEIKKLQVLKNRTQKYKPGDPITEENFGDTPFAPSQETLDNLKKAREMTKGMNLEEEMNMVLNQYDKSMFVKNEQGIVDVTNPENVQKMALLLKRDHPELYRRLEMEIGNQDNILEGFDVTGRKPNADGGIAGLI